MTTARRPNIIWVMVAFGLLSVSSTANASPHQRPRVVVTTDGEVDDRCSMVRFLLYANQWDTRALVISSSKHHWAGNDTIEAYRWPGTDWIDRHLAAYEEVFPTLSHHEPGFPPPDSLRSRVFIGNIAYEGEMDAPSPGSQRIVEVLLERDTSAVWLQAWGGPNTIARALKTIQEDHPDRIPEVTEKARLFLISEQDSTFSSYIRPNWPDLQAIVQHHCAYGVIAYRWDDLMPAELHGFFESPWMRENILSNHGALCSMYEARRGGGFRSEGDSPSFLHLIDVGLRSLEHPGYGGWGGRFEQRRGAWRSPARDEECSKTLWRWAMALQNDFAARADWCVSAYESANHPPAVRLSHAENLRVAPSDTIVVSALPTTDPDGDEVAFRWWHFSEAGACEELPILSGANTATASIVIPESASGKSLHFVCEAIDNGSPPLTRYGRVVVTVDN